MRYPLWAFLFVFVLPPFTVHALLSGAARIEHEVSLRPSQLIKPMQAAKGTVRIRVGALPAPGSR